MLVLLLFMQVHVFFFFYSLLNEQGLISKNHMKARTYPNVAKKLVWNPFPGNRNDDSMRIFLLQQGRTRARAGTFTSSLHTEDHNIACSYSTGGKKTQKKHAAYADVNGFGIRTSNLGTTRICFN